MTCRAIAITFVALFVAAAGCSGSPGASPTGTPSGLSGIEGSPFSDDSPPNAVVHEPCPVEVPLSNESYIYGRVSDEADRSAVGASAMVRQTNTYYRDRYADFVNRTNDYGCFGLRVPVIYQDSIDDAYSFTLFVSLDGFQPVEKTLGESGFLKAGSVHVVNVTLVRAS